MEAARQVMPRPYGPGELCRAFQVYDFLITAKALTSAIKHYIKEGGVGRESLEPCETNPQAGFMV